MKVMSVQVVLGVSLLATGCGSIVRDVKTPELNLKTKIEISVLEVDSGMLGKRKAAVYLGDGLICDAQNLGKESAVSSFRYDIPIGAQLSLVEVKRAQGCSLFFGECSTNDHSMFDLQGVGVIDGSEFYCFGKLNQRVVEQVAPKSN
jgi:hypothetical protein